METCPLYQTDPTRQQVLPRLGCTVEHNLTDKIGSYMSRRSLTDVLKTQLDGSLPWRDVFLLSHCTPCHSGRRMECRPSM